MLCDLFTLLKCYLNILVKNWNNQGIHLICFSTLFKCLLLFHHLCQEGHSKINFNTSGERKVQQVVLRFYGSLHHSLSRYSVSLFSYFLLPLLYINVFLYGDRVVILSFVCIYLNCETEQLMWKLIRSNKFAFMAAISMYLWVYRLASCDCHVFVYLNLLWKILGI